MKELKVKWTGIRPMIPTTTRTVDDLDPITIQLKELQKGKAKDRTEDTMAQIARLDWEAAMPFQDGAIYITSEKIEKCIKDGAAKSKNGKKFEAACLVRETEVSITGLKYPKTLDGLYAAPDYKARMPVKIPPRTGATIMKTKPMIPTGWELIFTIEYDEGIINEKDILKACQDAGALVGIGGWRPKFGRFTVEKV